MGAGNIDWALTWQMVEAIATCVLIVGIGVAIWQIQDARRRTKAQLKQMERNTRAQLAEVRRSTNAQIAVGLFENLRDEKILETLREIIYENDRDVIKGFVDDDKRKGEIEKIGRVLDWLDMMGVLVRKDIVDKELAVRGYAGNMTIRCWYQLAPYIRKLQDRRGNYATNYEVLAHQCLGIFSSAHMRCFLEGVDGDLVKLIEGLPENQRPRSLKKIQKDRQEDT